RGGAASRWLRHRPTDRGRLGGPAPGVGDPLPLRGGLLLRLCGAAAGDPAGGAGQAAPDRRDRPLPAVAALPRQPGLSPMQTLILLLAIAGALAIVRGLGRTLLRLGLRAAEETTASGMAEVSARRGDITGLSERRQVAQAARRER